MQAKPVGGKGETGRITGASPEAGASPVAGVSTEAASSPVAAPTPEATSSPEATAPTVVAPTTEATSSPKAAPSPVADACLVDGVPTEVGAPKPDAATASRSEGPQARGDRSLLALGMGEAHQIQTICLMVLTVLACGTTAYYLRDVLLPFVLALFLFLIIRPLPEWMVRKFKMSNVLSTTITMLIALVALGLLASLITNSVLDVSVKVSDYEDGVKALLDKVFESELAQRIGLDQGAVFGAMAKNSVEIVSGFLGTLANSVVTFFSHAIVVGIYLMFLLFGCLGNGADSGPAQSPGARMYRDIRDSIEEYVRLKSTLSMVVGALTWLILSLLGVEMAFVFGLCAFALNFVPNVGPIVAVILPLPLVILGPDASTIVVLLAILLPGLVHMLVGNIIETNMMGESLELDPVVVLLALMLAGVIWGPVGMLLATPMTVVLRILLERVEWAAPLARLLAGRGDPKIFSEPVDEDDA